MKKVFQKYCDSALLVLNSQYEATKVLQHHSTAGSAREQILKDFLTNHLPELITVLSGQIIDAYENISRQQDIVLVLKSMPRLPFSSGDDLIFQEGVVASIEIKTHLDSLTLRSIGDNFASIHKLKPSIGASSHMGITHKWPVSRILTSIVTYGGSRFDVLERQLSKLSDNEKPDLVLNLSKGLLVRNHDLLLQRDTDHDYITIDDAGEGFKYFLTFLTEITGTLASRGVTWRSYW